MPQIWFGIESPGKPAPARSRVTLFFQRDALAGIELNHAPVIRLACGSAIIAPKVPHCWKPSNQFRGRDFPGPPTLFFLVSVL
jgi:hypothetical protein